ncbi:GAF domain-containing protein [Janthinobacterium sp. RB2P8]|uniref:GAF domain-containing protein n=1 Tax=Janthinobacterium sp. RB2P8 TaxID=3424191 RepID=UPI003F26A766
MTKISDDPILTTRAAAELLGVAVSTAQQWVESGAIPSWKTPGGHRRVRLSAVRDLIEQKTASVIVRPPIGPSSLEFVPSLAPAYPVAPDEAERLLALDATGLVDTPIENVFDRLTWLASQVTDSPMAIISLLTARRQWFKSRIGIEASETSRDWAFCSYAVLQAGVFVVEDALLDPRFKNNPLVTGEPYIRFYAGFPLEDKEGHPVGTLCVLDREPRKLRDREVRALRELSTLASEEIQRRTST